MRPSLAKRRLDDIPTFLDGEDEDAKQRRELAQLERRRHEISQKLKEIENKERNLNQVGAESTYSKTNQKRPRPDQHQHKEEEEEGGEYPNKRRVISSAVVSQESKESDQKAAEEQSSERRSRDQERGKSGEDARERLRDSARDRGDRVRDERESERDRNRKRAREERFGTKEGSGSYREEGREDRKRRREDSEQHSATEQSSKPKPPTIAPKEVQRTRKMFGVLLGTLQRFKKEEDVKTEKDVLREKVEEQVKNQVIAEHQELVAQERERIQKEKEEYSALKEALSKEIEEKETNFLSAKWQRQSKLLANPLFKKTTAQPCIYFSVNQSMKDIVMPPSPSVLSGDDENGESREEEEEEEQREGQESVATSEEKENSTEQHKDNAPNHDEEKDNGAEQV